MPIVQAYKCPRTDKLFLTKDEYWKYLRQQGAIALRVRRAKRRVANMQSVFADMRKNCMNEVEILHFIREHWETFVMNSFERNWDRYAANYEKALEKFKMPELKNIEILNFSSLHNVSNSHAAPIGKAKNWHRHPELPTYYPGWTGKLRFEYKGTMPGFSSDIFNDTGINCGSGGGGRTHYECQISLFADDFQTMVVMRKLLA